MRFLPLTLRLVASSRATVSPQTKLPLAASYIARGVAGKVPLLLSPKQLKELPKATTVPVDCSWHMPNSPRSALAEYLSGPRIPGARRFDQDEVAELDVTKNPLSLSHMLPSTERFAQECRKLGIREDDHVVLYDTIGIFSSPRGAFTFKALGHEKVSVLDGGLPRWIEEGNEIEMGDVADVGESEYTGKAVDQSWVRSYEEMVENSEKAKEEGEIVLDHRTHARYTGEAPEPRQGLSSGHIPNSLPMPFSSYLEPSSSSKSYTSFKSPSELKSVLVAGVGGEAKWKQVESGEKPIVFTCGSGMTAAVGWLADKVVAEQEGTDRNTAIYDESWTGWASRKESKIVKGET